MHFILKQLVHAYQDAWDPGLPTLTLSLKHWSWQNKSIPGELHSATLMGDLKVVGTHSIYFLLLQIIFYFTSKSGPYWSTPLILEWRCSPSIFHSPAKMFPLLIQRIWRLWPSRHCLVPLDCLWTMLPLLLFFYLCHSVFGWNQPKIFSKFSKDSSHHSSGRWHVDKDV